MLRIAVVDDDPHMLNRMQRYLDQFQIAYDFNYRTDTFISCEAVCQAISAGGRYDLLFLDIEFPEMRGTELGLLLRRHMKNDDTQIIFFSAVRDYAMELFRIRPIEFLIKPITYERFSACMLAFFTHYREACGFLEYTMDNIRRQIRISEVCYLESHGKKVELHTRLGDFMVYGKTDELISAFSEQFLRISRGVLVNIRHIVEATPREVMLTDGSSLHISRGRQNTVRDRLAEL